MTSPAKRVYAGVPAVCRRCRTGQPTNRLGLARWLVDPEHPLTARVTVNRFWQQYFRHRVWSRQRRTSGRRGSRRRHPELLDWLATEFVASGWDVKHMQRLIVTSATYRQSSRVTPELVAARSREPAAGPRPAVPPRRRGDARQRCWRSAVFWSRNWAAGACGRISRRGIWEPVGFHRQATRPDIAQDNGDALYRRSLYTFWKRTAPPPFMTTFDAPTARIVHRCGASGPTRRCRRWRC